MSPGFVVLPSVTLFIYDFLAQMGSKLLITVCSEAFHYRTNTFKRDTSYGDKLNRKWNMTRVLQGTGNK